MPFQIKLIWMFMYLNWSSRQSRTKLTRIYEKLIATPLKIAWKIFEGARVKNSSNVLSSLSCSYNLWIPNLVVNDLFNMANERKFRIVIVVFIPICPNRSWNVKLSNANVIKASAVRDIFDHTILWIIIVVSWKNPNNIRINYHGSWPVKYGALTVAKL